MPDRDRDGGFTTISKIEFENQVGWVIFKIGDRSHEGDQFFLEFLVDPLQGLFIVLLC